MNVFVAALAGVCCWSIYRPNADAGLADLPPPRLGRPRRRRLVLRTRRASARLRPNAHRPTGVSGLEWPEVAAIALPLNFSRQWTESSVSPSPRALRLVTHGALRCHAPPLSCSCSGRRPAAWTHGFSPACNQAVQGRSCIGGQLNLKPLPTLSTSTFRPLSAPWHPPAYTITQPTSTYPRSHPSSTPYPRHTRAPTCSTHARAHGFAHRHMC